MIYEIRTYTVTARSTPELEKRFGEAYEARKKYSPLAAFFHTDVGPLNEVIHIWPYADLGERTRIRAEAAKDPAWPPAIAEFIINQQVEIVVPFPFSSEWKPGKDGPYYELRQYSFRGGTLPKIIEAWQAGVPERTKFSPLVLLGNVEFGPTANSFIHIWPYASWDGRTDIRSRAAATGKWPPAGGGDYYLSQSNKILLPAAFSPAQ
jgi:hypothetical protein